MFKFVIFAALLAFAFAAPQPEADPKADPKAAPKPGIVAPLAYSAPLVAAPAVSYAYSAPLAYSSYVAAPSIYTAGYTAAYSTYPLSAAVVV